jgi:hypothetical protein
MEKQGTYPLTPYQFPYVFHKFPTKLTIAVAIPDISIISPWNIPVIKHQRRTFGQSKEVQSGYSGYHTLDYLDKVDIYIYTCIYIYLDISNVLVDIIHFWAVSPLMLAGLQAPMIIFNISTSTQCPSESKVKIPE